MKNKLGILFFTRQLVSIQIKENIELYLSLCTSNPLSFIQPLSILFIYTLEANLRFNYFGNSSYIFKALSYVGFKKPTYTFWDSL